MPKNNRPSWRAAPPWARWLAMDGNQAWWRYERKPIELQSKRIWENHTGTRYAPVDSIVGKEYNPEWSFTLEHRPKK